MDERKKQEYNNAELPELLRIYYRRLFPFKLMHRWLSYADDLTTPKDYFARREFAFILKNDTYLRYRCFQSIADFEREVNMHQPEKIDIGAVFNLRPKDKDSPYFEALERELVFDIDLTDYDDVRTCCKEGNMCGKCWRFMIIAVQILDRALEEDFGFEHRLWVYSGRRGVHCWVCDASARKLSQAARGAIVSYLNIFEAGSADKKTKTVYLPYVAPVRNQMKPKEDPIPRLFRRSLELILSEFPILVVEQNWESNQETIEKMSKIIDESPFHARIQDKEVLDVIKKQGISEENARELLLKFLELCTKAGTIAKENKKKPKIVPIPSIGENMPPVLEELVLQYAYPRLDVNVSKGLNHLLKSPFCVHPKTGRVSVPFDPQRANQFEPMEAPRVDLLCLEMAVLDVQEQENVMEVDEAPVEGKKRKPLDYKRSALSEAIEVFEHFLEKLSGAAL